MKGKGNEGRNRKKKGGKARRKGWEGCRKKVMMGEMRREARQFEPRLVMNDKEAREVEGIRNNRKKKKRM